MCIATRCTSVEQFIQMFARFVDEESFFVSTHNTRPPGLETSFSVQLVDGTPVLRGICTVLQSWGDANNVFKTPGVRLGIKRLTASSMQVFEKLLITRGPDNKANEIRREMDTAPTKVVPKSEVPKLPPLPAPPAPERTDTQTDTQADEAEIEMRTPGSDYVLPANPLQNLSDVALDGFVDCTLYEETGNFFPTAEDDGTLLTDDVVPPPVLAPIPLLARPPLATPPAMPVVVPFPDALQATVSSVVMPRTAKRRCPPVSASISSRELAASAVHTGCSAVLASSPQRRSRSSSVRTAPADRTPRNPRPPRSPRCSRRRMCRSPIPREMMRRRQSTSPAMKRRRRPAPSRIQTVRR
jgi:hypothetical protein